MRSSTFNVAIGLLLLASIPARAQLSPSPPPGPLWEEQANGDAVQKDLGFIVPKRWKNFEREGFTSTRADGASTKAHYVSDDKAIRVGILLQLRPDVRGVDLGQDVVWALAQASASFEYADRTKSKPTELSSTEFRLGNRSPAGHTRWARYDLGTGPEVQGLWWQNIGVWSVIITMSGPEARRVDMEAQAKTLLTEMPFPSAPLSTELAVVGEKLLGGLPKCKGERPKGAGGEIVPTFQEAAALGLIMPIMVLGKANDSLISPVTRSESYCVVETFSPREDLAVTAIEYSGPTTDVWEARYGFAIANGRGGYYQIERLVQAEPMKSMAGEASTKHVYLDFSNNKRASLFAVFDEWPSYEAAKRAVVELYRDPKNKKSAVITMMNPAEKLVVIENPDRIQKADAK
ncbi:MAG: hypothetical protein ACJ8R9_21320 [Steroidobacteraceae bacterium]